MTATQMPHGLPIADLNMLIKFLENLLRWTLLKDKMNTFFLISVLIASINFDKMDTIVLNNGEIIECEAITKEKFYDLIQENE